MRRMCRYFSDNSKANLPIHVTISPDGLTWEIGSNTGIPHDWTAYNRIDKTVDGFLFHWDGRHMWIPMHSFKSKKDIDTLGGMAQQNAFCYEEIM
jgi:hypothetical protein